jgi:hypothetical protein
MRSLSASIDAALKIVLLGMLSCASTQPLVTLPEPAVIEGTISISGRHPYERQLILMGGSGDSWLLEGQSLEGELLELSGRPIRIYGVLRIRSSGFKAVKVDRYELIPLPGRIAAAGLLEASDGELFLRADHTGDNGVGRTLVISGPLRDALGHFIGYRVWITGERAMSAEGGSGTVRPGTRRGVSGEVEQTSVLIDVEAVEVIVREYGVLGPAMRPLRDAPRSTGPD